MAGQGRQDSHPVVQELHQQPWGHDFFQAVRRLECVFSDYPRVGRSEQLSGDAVRFGQRLTLSMAPTSLARSQNKDRPPKITVEFTGLTGPNGPLPLRMTEFIRNRLRGIQDPDALTVSDRGRMRGQSQGTGTAASGDDSLAPKDATLADFLDIFHHRLISLFYRAWAVTQKTADFDREDDRSYAEWLASLSGLGLPELDGQDAIPTWEKLPFTGHLACQTRHASGLAGILTDVFSTRAEVQPLTGHWINLPKQERCELSAKKPNPAICTLGSTCIVGDRMWDRSMKFTLVLGPMTLDQFESFLPGGRCHARLHDWVGFYTRRQFYWQAVLVLKKEEVPPTRLGLGGRLGHTTWLSSGPFAYDPRDYKVRGGGLTAAENS